MIDMKNKKKKIMREPKGAKKHINQTIRASQPLLTCMSRFLHAFVILRGVGLYFILYD